MPKLCNNCNFLLFPHCRVNLLEGGRGTLSQTVAHYNSLTQKLIIYILMVPAIISETLLAVLLGNKTAFLLKIHRRAAQVSTEENNDSETIPSGIQVYQGKP
ncbi:hypothetical protein GDO78_012219 [Eleutherodactylus coqui]|uniref:Uncharacterized protein n=1 Tax=Eleutherodactylus coqui TaxID=57060 RepID=A0A8J6F3Z3_ELECQ|nr:hypothetical protein GDO78_012219 [Eleutherodactylus coqui]